MTDLHLHDMEIFHLDNLSIATKYMVADQGSPRAYERLAQLGLAERKGPGYQITELGLATLKLNKHRLFGRKSRLKRKEKYNEDSEV